MDETRDGSMEIERIVFFSDAVFAIAITLMVVDLRVPESVDDAGLGPALRDLTPQYVSFFLSFVVIGVFWIAHHRMFRYIRRWDQGLIGLNLLFLLAVAFLPFPTSLIGRFEKVSIAAVIYSATVLVCSAMSALLWRYASNGHRLVADDLPTSTISLIQTRALLIVVIFAIAVGAAFVSANAAQVIWWLAFPAHFAVLRLFRKRFEPTPA